MCWSTPTHSIDPDPDEPAAAGRPCGGRPARGRDAGKPAPVAGPGGPPVPPRSGPGPRRCTPSSVDSLPPWGCGGAGDNHAIAASSAAARGPGAGDDRAGRDGLGERVHVAGGGVVDDGDLGAHDVLQVESFPALRPRLSGSCPYNGMGGSSSAITAHGRPPPAERADAARNRQRLIDAAQRIVRRQGIVAGLALDEVARPASAWAPRTGASGI